MTFLGFLPPPPRTPAPTPTPLRLTALIPSYHYFYHHLYHHCSTTLHDLSKQEIKVLRERAHASHVQVSTMWELLRRMHDMVLVFDLQVTLRGMLDEI